MRFGPPAGITEDDWESTPARVRELVHGLLEIAWSELKYHLEAGTALVNRERFDEACPLLTKALATARTLGERPLQAWLLDLRSRAEVGLGHFDHAESFARDALAIAEAVEDGQLRSAALTSLGVALMNRGQSGAVDATEYLRQAVAAAQASNSPVMPAATANLAAALLRTSNLTEAGIWLDRAEEIVGEYDPDHLVLCQINRATLASLRGERQNAVDRAHRACALAAKDDRARWMALITLAVSLSELGDELEGYGGDQPTAFDAATWIFEEAAALAKRLRHDQGVLVARLNRAMLLSRRGQHEGARDGVRDQVLPLAQRYGDRRIEAYCWLNLADMLLADLLRVGSSRDDARGLPGRGFAPLGPVRVPGIIGDISVGEQSSLMEADVLYRRARILLISMKDDEGLRVISSRLGDLHARRPSGALKAAAYYRRAIARWERARSLLIGDAQRISFLGRGLDPYHGLLALCVREGHKAAAFAVAEQARARSLVESVARLTDLPDSTPHLSRKPDGVAGPQAAYADLRNRSPATSDALRAFLSAADAELDRLPRPGGAADYPRRAVLVSFAIGPGAVHLFVLRSDLSEPELISLPFDASRLRQLAISNFGSAGRVRELSQGRYVEQWYSLRWLVAPLADLANPGDLIYLAPQGILHNLPLHTLELDGLPLGQRNTVAYIPSASLLPACRARRRPDLSGAPSYHRTAVFGDSRMDLPYAHAEAIRLGETFGVTPHVGSEVTALTLGEALKASDLVHIAGHAKFGEQRRGEESAIFLADGKCFTAQDVLALRRLDAQLVTLSCCETGVSDELPGDERIGLHRALLLTGARSMLLSLWRVGDDSGAYLMDRLYGYLRSPEGWCVADALHLAMRDTAQHPSWSSFYYWSPFILLGDWR